MAKYDAYLLRIWHDDRQWAARLEHLPNGAVLRFSSADALAAYLSGIGESGLEDGAHRGLTAISGSATTEQTGGARRHS